MHTLDKSLLQENSSRFSVVYIFAVPIIIFLYFLQWKTNIFYGDDLDTYKYYLTLKTFSDKVNIAVMGTKYRPVHGISLQLLIDSFGNNANGYYWFNVFIQSVNTLIFARLLNFYLKSELLSIGVALILGLSRFAIYNMTQLTNGGALEGLGLTFVLCCLHFIIRHFHSPVAGMKDSKNMLFAILFANLSLYTHERYIVLLPFLLLILITDAMLKGIKQRRLMLLVALVLGSICLNVFIKKYVFAIPFFVGTGGTNVDFSFSQALTYMKQALLSIFLINSGPVYLTGIEYASLDGIYHLLIIVLLSSVFLVMLFSLSKQFKSSSLKNKTISPGIIDFALLCILFFLFLAPAIVTIRVEQRWLQASLSIFLLLTVISLTSIHFNNRLLRNSLLASFALLFMIVDRQYLSKGADNLYMVNSENTVAVFKRAIDDGTIRGSAKNLYFWEKAKDPNAESATKWNLSSGYFFDFYGDNGKNIFFVDSVYQRLQSSADTTFFNFNAATDQILVGTAAGIADITDSFLRDSLKNFDVLELANAGPAKLHNGPINITIDAKTLADFTTDGFYENENGLRWTNGDASIKLNETYKVSDSVFIYLKTYLPPKSKNVVPEIALVGEDRSTMKATLLKKEGDNFIYGLRSEKVMEVSKLTIKSDTFDASPDIRKLSFPFISITVRQAVRIK